MPLRTVAVIIPAYNAASVLSEAVRSVLSQSRTPAEVIVVDDGSTDGTREVLREYPNIRYIYQENAGPAAARNRGLAETKAEIIAFLDADDIWDRDKLKISMKPFTGGFSIPEIVVYTNYVVQEVPSGVTHPPRVPRLRRVRPEELLISFNEVALHTSTVVMPRDIIEKVGRFDESLARGEDWDLWIRLSERYPFHYIDLPLTRVRSLPTSQTSRTQAQWRSVTEKVILKCLKRRPDIYAKIEKRLYSRYYLKLGLAAYEALDFKKARSELSKSLKEGFNWQAAKYFARTFLGKRAVRDLRRLKPTKSGK